MATRKSRKRSYPVDDSTLSEHSSEEKSKKRKNIEHEIDIPSLVVAMETDKPIKPKAKPKINPLKPKSKSWIPHIAGILVYNCAKQALANSIDPREHLDNIDWSVWAPDVLLGPDLHKLWVYISQEYSSERSLSEILEELEPLGEVSPETLDREHIRMKYRDLMPKQPMTAYFMFHQSKREKLKRKHPELSETEVAGKLGQRWRSMSIEDKDKYIQHHNELKEEYKRQLEAFYSEHPEAKPIKSQKTKRKKKPAPKKTVSTLAESEIPKVLELKKLAPRKPVSAYIMFCTTNREKIRAKHPELSPTDVTIKLGQKWKTMSESTRAKYKRKFDESLESYKQEIEEFYNNNPGARELLSKKSDKSLKSKKQKQTKTTTIIVNEENEQEQNIEEETEEAEENAKVVEESDEQDKEEQDGKEEHSSDSSSDDDSSSASSD